MALVAVAAAVVSDDTSSSFWRRHALLTSLTASVIVVMLSVAVINEILERRARQRWRVLAQYVMFELVVHRGSYTYVIYCGHALTSAQVASW